jgi:endonuclease/exonuclease/phosphatase family metal-dependent hydrolase
MWTKLLLGALFVTSLVGAFVLAPESKPARTDLTRDADRGQDRRSLRLISWNIGNGDLESETRAHVEDLPAVAELIKNKDADAVALQELTGKDQLRVLLAHLENRYRGYVCNSGGADRVDAVLVKNDNSDRNRHGVKDDQGLRFNNVPAGDRFAGAATFRLPNLPEVVLVSAHADAFSASRRRRFVAEVVDWARSRNGIIFIAGDFNFEVSVRNKTNLFTDDAKHDSESYAYLLKYFRDLGRDAGETSINDRRIDYIFGPPETVSLRRAEVLRDAAIGRMDHWPLLVEVDL